MTDHNNKTNSELLAEIERLEKLNDSYKSDNSIKVLELATENISDPLNLEELLVKQEDMFELVIDTIPTQIFWKDLNSVYLGCNLTFAQAAGEKSTKSIIGKTDFDLSWKNQAQRYVDDDKKVLESGVPKLEYEESYLLSSGEKVWWVTSKIPLKDGTGKITGVICTSKDITVDKKMNEQVVKNKKRLGYALESIETGAWELDLETKDSWRSLKHDQIFGYSEPLDEWTYDMFLEHVVGEDRKMVDDKFQKAIATKTDWNFECRINRKDGAVRWILGKGNQELDKSGKPTVMFGIVQDITERKLADVKLKSSEEKFRLLYNNSPDMHCSVSADNAMVLMCNDTLLKNLNYTREELIGVSIFNFYHEDCIEEVNGVFQKFLKTGIVNNHELSLKRKDGSKIDVSLKVYAVKDENGKILHSMSSWRDITERKLTEEKIRTVENRLKKTFDLSPSIISRVNLKTGYFIEVNKAVTSILGYSVEEFTSRPFNEFIHPEDLQKTNNEKNEQIEGKEVTFFENRYLCKDGSYTWLAWHGTPPNDKGIVTAIGSDISEHKLAQQKLNQSTELLKVSQGIAKLGGWELDVKSNQLFWTEEVYRIHDLDIKDFKPSVESAMVHLLPESTKKLLPVVKSATEKGDSFDLELEILSKKGRRVDIRMTCEATIQDGKPTKLTGTFQDITEQKNAEKELVQSVTFNQGIVDNSFDCIKTLDLEGNLQFMSKGGQHLLEIDDVKEYIGKPWYDIFIEDERQMAIDAVNSALSGGIGRFKSYIPTEKGKPMWWDAIVTPISDGYGKITNVLAISRDITERKVAEMALEENEEKFRTLINEIPTGVYLTDADGQCIYINPNWSKMSGLTLEQAKGDGWKNGIHPEDRELVFSNWTKMIESNGNWSLEYRMSDGKNEYWVSGQAKELRNDGQFIGYIGVNTDITERKEAEERIRESEEKFQGIFEQSPLAIQIYDMDGKLLRVNNKTLDLFGLEDEKQIIGFNLWEDPNLTQDTSEALNNGDPIFISTSFDFDVIKGVIPFPTTRNGIIHLDMYVVPLVQEKTNTGFLVQIVEITERKESEKALKQSEEKFKSLMHQSPFVVELYSLDGLQIEVNKAYEELWGFPASTTVNIFNILESREVVETGLIDYVNRAYNGETVKVPEYEFNPSGETESGGYGRIRHLNTSIYPIKNDEDKVFNIVVVHQDVTDRKQAEQSLLQSEEKFKALVTNNEEIIYMIDIDGNFLLSEGKGLTKLGLKRGEVVGQSVFDLYKDFPDMLDQMRATFKGETLSFEVKVGDQYFSNWYSPHKNSDGEIIGLLGLSVNITKVKRAENDLYESLQREQLQANIVRNSPVGIAFGYPDGSLENCNKAFSDLTGYSEEELKTINWNNVLTPEKWNDIEAVELEKLSFENNIIQYEKEYIHKSGKTIPIELVVTAKFDTENNLIHFIGFVSDITERKSTEQELKKHRENLEELVKERTIDLEEKNIELERFNNLFVDREIRIKELRNEIENLKK